MSIRRPLSPGGGWIEVSLYRAYADLARENLTAGRYFEAILVCSVGYDVLVNTLPDRILIHHSQNLTADQQSAIKGIERKKLLTAGDILNKLRKASILYWRLDRAFTQFNQMRNKVVHPIERKETQNPNGSGSFSLSLKRGAVLPYKSTKEDAERYFRYFCHIIDLCGGESPSKHERLGKRYSLAKILDDIEDERKVK